jgi:hypothetical protein
MSAGKSDKSVYTSGCVNKNVAVVVERFALSDNMPCIEHMGLCQSGNARGRFLEDAVFFKHTYSTCCRQRHAYIQTMHSLIYIRRGQHANQNTMLGYPHADVHMPNFTSAIPTPAPIPVPRHACNHAIPVNVHRYHVVVSHASPAYRSSRIRCVLHMDPCKAINVGISVSHVFLSTVGWGLLSHHTTILLLLSVP